MNDNKKNTPWKMRVLQWAEDKPYWIRISIAYVMARYIAVSLRMQLWIAKWRHGGKGK